MATNKAAAPKKAKALTKNGLITAIAEAVGEEISRKQVKFLLDSLAEVGHKELKKSKIFTLPGFAKFRVVDKAATKARTGTNPFNGQPMTFPAKPKSKSVRARPIKAIKEAVA